MITPQPHDPYLDNGLLEYLAEPPQPAARDLPGLRDLWVGAHKLASALAEQRATEGPPSQPATANSSVGQGERSSGPRIGISARFSGLVRLPGASVAAMLADWWAAGASDGAVTVARRLRLGPPRGGPGIGWTMNGRVRRLTRWHWVPVVVELWPVHGNWTMMTMTPQARVIASRRYFRTGHFVLDRLTAELAESTASAVDPRPRPTGAAPTEPDSRGHPSR